MKYFKKLKEIYLHSKKETKIDNMIRDAVCISIFKNSKYLTDLAILDLRCNKDWNKNRV